MADNTAIDSKSVSVAEMQKIALMGNLDSDQLGKIQKTTSVVRIDKGRPLFEREQVADRFYWIRTGQINLFRTSVDCNERVMKKKEKKKQMNATFQTVGATLVAGF